MDAAVGTTQGIGIWDWAAMTGAETDVCYGGIFRQWKPWLPLTPASASAGKIPGDKRWI